MGHVLPQDCKIVPILSPLAAEASADRSSSVIDTKGYNRCTVLVHFGTIDGAADAQDISLNHADAASNGTTLTTGTAVATSGQAVASDNDNGLYYIDFIPTKRFAQLVVNKDATNNTNETAVAILYDAQSQVPATHATGSGTSGGSGAVSGEVVGVAADGTA